MFDKIKNEPIYIATACMVALLAEFFLGQKYGFAFPEEVRAMLVTTIATALGISARANLKGPATAKLESSK
jgi:hypothetical protein